MWGSGRLVLGTASFFPSTKHTSEGSELFFSFPGFVLVVSWWWPSYSWSRSVFTSRVVYWCTIHRDATPWRVGTGKEGGGGKWVGEPINILLQALHLNNFSTGYQQSLAISLMTVTYIIKTGWWRRAEKFFLMVFRSVRDGLKKQTKMEWRETWWWNTSKNVGAMLMA